LPSDAQSLPPELPNPVGEPRKRCPFDGGPKVRIHLPPALSHVRTRLPRSVGRLASTCGYHCPLGGSGLLCGRQVGAAETLLDDAIRLAKVAGGADVRVGLQIWPKPGPNSPDDSTFHKEVLSRRTRADNRSGAVSRFRRGSPATTPSAMLADELRGRACSPAYCLMATATA
jgi:hypothetical protein